MPFNETKSWGLKQKVLYKTDLANSSQFCISMKEKRWKIIGQNTEST